MCTHADVLYDLRSLFTKPEHPHWPFPGRPAAETAREVGLPSPLLLGQTRARRAPAQAGSLEARLGRDSASLPESQVRARRRRRLLWKGRKRGAGQPESSGARSVFSKGRAGCWGAQEPAPGPTAPPRPGMLAASPRPSHTRGPPYETPGTIIGSPSEAAEPRGHLLAQALWGAVPVSVSAGGKGFPSCCAS